MNEKEGEYWCCPNCSNLITEVEYFSAREIYDCPRCKEVDLGEYNKCKVYE